MNANEIDHAIQQLKSLMSNDEATEHDYQKYFEEAPVAMAALGYVKAHPHLALRSPDGDLIPDFFVRRAYGLFEICEIKTPVERILKDTKNRAEFFAKISSEYAGQIRRYSEFFNDAANRAAFTAEHGIEVPPRPKKTLIIGRSQKLDKFELHMILASRGFEFELITYDDVLDCLTHQLESLHFDGGERFGITLSLMVRIIAAGGVSEEYLFDLYEPSTNERISLLIGGDKFLRFVVTNHAGRTESYNVASMGDPGELGAWRHLQFSLASREGFSKVEIRQNGEFFENREMARNFYRRRGLEYTNIIFGTDVTRSKGAAFDFSFERAFNCFLSRGDQLAEDELGRQRLASLRNPELREPILRLMPEQWMAAAGPFPSGKEPRLEVYYDARPPEPS